MQTFMIPGTIFMSLLAGALFGVIKGGILVVFTATAGASSCYFVSKLIGRPLVSWLWPEKLRYFQSEVSCCYFCWLQFLLILPTNSKVQSLFHTSSHLLMYYYVINTVVSDADCKEERKAIELYAFSENNSNFTQHIHKYGITNC